MDQAPLAHSAAQKPSELDFAAELRRLRAQHQLTDHLSEEVARRVAAILYPPTTPRPQTISDRAA